MLFRIWFETVHWFKESRVSFEKVGPREHNGGTILTRRPETTNVRWNLGEKVVNIDFENGNRLTCWTVRLVLSNLCLGRLYRSSPSLGRCCQKRQSAERICKSWAQKWWTWVLIILIFTQSLILREIAVIVTIYRGVLVVSSLASEVLSKDDRKYTQRTSLCSN